MPLLDVLVKDNHHDIQLLPLVERAIEMAHLGEVNESVETFKVEKYPCPDMIFRYF